jgi:NAD(P)-dependent dehydrogenase (short-subunit alcohol dehydrogenase family)
MAGRVQDKIACVTGAASGIGRATALLLAREGAIVVATDIQADKGAALLAEIESQGGSACFLAHDVADEAQWQGVIAEISARYGRLDILVNNAGVGYSGPVTEMSLELWRRQMAINVDGVFLGVKHALPLMRESGAGGSIINVSSIAGIKASANVSGYNASKGAVRLFTKSIALECAAAKDGIRVNSLHPGVVETAIWDTLIGTTEDGSNGRPRTATLDAAVQGAIPLGHLGTADDMANGILWLASDESRYVTGTELVIDGGRSIG